MALGNDQAGGGGSPGKEFGEFGELEEGGDGWMVGEGWLDGWGTGNFQLAHHHRCLGQGGNSTGS